MKRILALLLAAVMLLAVMAGCASKTDTADDAAPAADAPADDAAAPADTADEDYGAGYTFIHGFDESFPPYSYIAEDGSLTGFDVELAQAVCAYWGWTYEGHPMNWDLKDAELNSGSCDCIWSGFTLNGREDDYTWSIVYSDNTQMIMVPEDSDITTLADLAGKLVGVQISTSADDMLNDEEGQLALKETFQELKTYENYTVAFNDMQAGAIDAIAVDVTTGNHLMGDAGGFRYLDEDLGSEQYAIGFRLGDDALRDKVNEALQALVADGTYDAIGQKYDEIYDYLCLN